MLSEIYRKEIQTARQREIISLLQSTPEFTSIIYQASTDKDGENDCPWRRLANNSVCNLRAGSNCLDLGSFALSHDSGFLGYSNWSEEERRARLGHRVFNFPSPTAAYVRWLRSWYVVDHGVCFRTTFPFCLDLRCVLGNRLLSAGQRPFQQI